MAESEKQPLLNSVIAAPSTSIWKSHRNALALLLMVGFILAQSMRTNFNMAMVLLLNNTGADNDVNSTDVCPSPLENSTVHPTARGPATAGFDQYNYDEGIIFGAFYYGYALMQIPGGRVADKIGGKLVLGLAIFLSAICNSLFPLAVKNLYFLVGLRILQGMCQAPLFPATYAFFGVWGPPLERTRLIAFSTTGCVIGAVISQGISGVLCNSTFLGGWPSVFYITGAVCMLWSVAWFVYASDMPKSHHWITVVEKNYIESETRLTNGKKFPKVPWGRVLRSAPIWAYLFVSLCDGFGYYAFYTGMPLYLKQVLKFDIEQNGFLSSVPYLSSWLVCLCVGPAVDYIRSRNILSTTRIRKICSLIGEGGVGVFMIALCFVACDQVLAVFFLIMALTINGVVTGGFILCPLDLMPMYSGTLMGVSNTLNNLCGFLSPLAIASITGSQASRSGWQKVFFIAGVIYIVGSLVFTVFGSSELEPWVKEAMLEERDEDEDEADRGSDSNTTIQAERDPLILPSSPHSPQYSAIG